MNSPNITPKLLLQRAENILNKTKQSRLSASKLLDIALKDAAIYLPLGVIVRTPEILNDANIEALSKLYSELSELEQYHEAQYMQFSSIFPVVDDIQSAVLSENPVPVQNTRSTLNQQSIVTRELLPPSKSKLPEPIDVETIHGAEETKVSDQHTQSPNALIDSLKILFSNDSPLLDIFAPTPWTPQGRGTITVGSTNFQWYRHTDPMTRDALARATVPSGFYSGIDFPQYVVIRMTECILIWSFDLSPESMLVYMLGVSDTNPELPRWFKPTYLSSTYTRRLVDELKKFSEQIQ